MGRKKTPGSRSAGGRKKKPTTTIGRTKKDYGNTRVVARLARFEHACILGGKAAHDAFDGPGQLHAMGYFHGQGFEPDVIRDILREYADLYWYWYAALQAKCAGYEPRIRGEPGWDASKAETRFQALDRCLGLTSRERQAVHKIAVDNWGNDDVHPFVERMVNEGMRQRGLPVAGYLPTAEDVETLHDGLRAAFQLIDQTLRPRFAPVVERELMKLAA